MNTEFEAGRAELEALSLWYDDHRETRNEATTRLHLINTLVFQCLGWPKDAVHAEEPHGTEYTDYEFVKPRRLLILEAKKQGDYFTLPAGYRKIEYSIRTMCRLTTGIRAAIEQAAKYCQTRGVPYAAVSNGHQFVVFLGARDDSIPPLDGKALVFSGFETMLAHFLDFWNALSPAAIAEGRLRSRLLGAARPDIPPKLSLSIPQYPGLKQRNQFQLELKLLSELAIEDIPQDPDLRQRFLRDCYCKGGALSQHALVSKQILDTRYTALFAANQPQLAATPATTKDGIQPELLARSLSRRPILILGDIGVGKTTFLLNLFEVEARESLATSLVLQVDLGTTAAITTELRKYVLQHMMDELFVTHGIDILNNDFVRAVYHGELTRFRDGIHTALLQSDPAAFAIHELQHLADLLSRKDNHLRRSLQHLSRGRKQQVVVVIDNADQRGFEDQESAFLIAQELSATWDCLVFLSLRPETFYRSQKDRTLSAYNPRVFTVAPPRVDRVIDLRLRFLEKTLPGGIPGALPGCADPDKLGNLLTLIRAFLFTISVDSQLIECIDNTANGNVRIALELVKDFFGSGHVNSQEIIDGHRRTRHFMIPLHSFVRAMVFRDCDHYDPRQSRVGNVFDVSRLEGKEHFLILGILAFLSMPGRLANEMGFVETQALYETFQGFGFTSLQIDSALLRSSAHQMIESAERAMPKVDNAMPFSFRLTSVGAYMHKRLCRLFAYVDAVIVDTPILDSQYRARIGVATTIDQRLARARLFLAYMSEQWTAAKLVGFPIDWDQVHGEVSRDVELAEMRARAREARTGPSGVIPEAGAPSDM